MDDHTPSPRNSRHVPNLNVFSRLQALFPTPTSSSFPENAQNLGEPSANSKQQPPVPVQPQKFLKVRMLTWNMHDSVPKGDLEELLGAVPIAAPSDGSFPHLEGDELHPYHLVVVAGQECPSLLGIPMGLGAGFKLLDKEKDRHYIKDPEAREQDTDYDNPRGKHRKDKEIGDELALDASAGWTSMIEDWLCHGGARSNCVPVPSSPHSLGEERDKDDSLLPPTPVIAMKSLSTSDIHRRPTVKQRNGPYQLLIKERMMGIYLAVYINRGIRHLVRGTSRSAVTAGLIGGRVGNKGGVGLSINLDGTTLLFMNAHLAAHEGKIHHRLANYAKIKAELDVDDFLASDDPRVMAEDLTDRFDFTFLCGDLNFRLDLSRLHADWLIARQDYAQALAFDQLRNLMTNGQAFFGFSEAQIHFPPTFKYDVLRTIRKSKRRSKLHWKHGGEKARELTEVEEQELEEEEREEREEQDREDEDEYEHYPTEGASLASSIWTSGGSKQQRADADEENTFPSNGTPKLTISTAASKAKSKWRSLVTPSTSNSQKRFTIPVPMRNSLDSPKRPFTVSAKPASFDQRSQSRPTLASRAQSQRSVKEPQSEDEDEGNKDDRGVYDTSNKKRVPSWCDRILFKSTVEPDSDHEDEDGVVTQTRAKSRVGQFFVNAFRPRHRKESASSTSSSSHLAVFPSPTGSVTDDQSHILGLPPRRLTHHKSVEGFPITGKPVLGRASSLDVDLKLHRSMTDNIPSATPQPNNTNNLIPNNPSIPSRWRFLPFLSKDHHAHAPLSSELPIANGESSATTAGPSVPPPPPRPKHKKGDVVCVSYDTLDDAAMRRLEGRSDHRPVIGVYRIYI